MRIVSVALLLAALASPAAAATAEPEVYTASTTGDVTIDPEGRVVEVSLDHRQLGADVMSGFERQIREWRFAPIEQDGQPVRAKAHMDLSLFVIRQPGVEGLRLGFQQVAFIDPREKGRGGATSTTRRMDPPRYPREQQMASIGARVNLLVLLDDEGRVTRAAAEEVFLLGNEMSPGAMRRHAKVFSEVSERVAADWVIPGIKGGRAVVPVRYSPYVGEGRWIRTRVAPVEPPAWVAVERASKKVVALGSSGVQSSERWKLLTPLEG